MRLPIADIPDVAARHLCCGCGACAFLEPDRIGMTDVDDQGRRPVTRGGTAGDALRGCPGVGIARPQPDDGAMPDLLPAWGAVRSVWEGHASDHEVRWLGSSGGAITALAVFALEQLGMHGVLHAAARTDAPLFNTTVLSRTRDELLAATGSRYAPASPCEGLRHIAEAPGPCVFVGKPCDVAGARMAARLRPDLDRNLGLVIGFFCAGTPSTAGTRALLDALGVDDPADVVDIRYRGRGWPGDATVHVRTAAGVERRTMSYESSWGDVLQKHRPWRCRVCADHVGELADIAVGDAWNRPLEEGAPGRSLLLARTARGERILRAAAEAGYLALEPADSSVLDRAQPELLRTRGAVWGRLLALRLAGLPAPRFRGMPIFRTWWSRLSLRQKAQSVLGTWRRALRLRLWRPAPAAGESAA